MKRKIIAALVVLVTVTVVAPHLGAFGGSTETRNIDTTRYDMTVERVFEGTVAGREHVIEGLMYFPLKTGDRVIEVQLGPKDFVESRGFKVKAGEMLTVAGVPAIVGKREVLLAREVRKMTPALIIRDRNGEPLWDPNRPIQMDHEFDESVMCEMIEP